MKKGKVWVSSFVLLVVIMIGISACGAANTGMNDDVTSDEVSGVQNEDLDVNEDQTINGDTDPEQMPVEPEAIEPETVETETVEPEAIEPEQEQEQEVTAPNDEPAAAERDELVTENVEEISVEIVDFAFAPKTLEVAKGTAITFTNLDSVAHTATDEGGEFDSGSLAQNEEFTHIFQTAGEYSIYCKPHPSMKMTITVK